MSDVETRSPVRIRHFTRSLPMSLLRAREAVMRHFRPELRRYGLTEQQWRVLRALMTQPGMEVAELAESTFLLGPSLSRILRDLEGMGYIARRLDEADHRRSIISLSPDGAALIERVSPDSEAIYAEITRRFGAQRLTDLQTMLRELEALLADGPLIDGKPEK
ncbi:MAG: homoprotocatechuate degradation operon regulator HpaR [Hyphomicrobiales bacterium]|nr:homoprotocatechuate degradation operon regulator HpaR [Hyphomicrobiales bacterium]